ncbi:hypothetical protein DICPUDRAFT_94050 [Dictyostelium purpureum]|uniref:ribonuclease Z n=1 Tax=Dictyostelium purpureum TaxID=5786 RepID=F0ZER9_DICPU|nr:uncharacterized protein DICPUDRAFT_94050 [Dictyostelium purpureum]EGC37574.1 hypothetical protein DICPUDRAFT_94050 [Dictyostelium purpureum]|eukprot:XP_003285900.1 hypothetical protein DICPUDRAFT_94050 [Dictyostelium purpureum]
MKSFFEITGENGDTPTTSYLFSDSDRYFFDCGEGFQRFIKGRPNITLGKVKSIFITTLSWDCIGGIIGLFLTLLEYNVKIRVYGPKGLHKLLTASRDFQFGLNIEVYEINTHLVQVLRDELFIFHTLPIYKNQEQLEKSTVDESSQPEMVYYGKKPNFNQKKESYENSPIVCYIAQTKDFKGKFLPDRAVALGVPKGRAFKDLQDGNSVANKDGVMISPDQVMEPSVKGSKVAVIRCPSEEYFNGLFSHQHLFVDILVINHIVPYSVLKNQRYIEFMEGISRQNNNKVKHVIVNNDNCERSPGCLSSDLQISKLCKFIPNLFPNTADERIVKPIEFLSSNQTLNNNNVLPCKDATHIQLGPPQFAGNYEFLPMFNSSSVAAAASSVNEENDFVDNGKSMEDFINTEKGQEFKTQLDKQILQLESNPNKCCHPKILFTGTGSAIPSKYRNVTGNFITLKDGKNLLLDAGESTFGQLYRFFGPNKLKKELINLRMIWLSHLHADHHLGIPNLIEKREQFAKELGVEIQPIYIIGPEPLIKWVTELSSILPMKFVGIAIGKDCPDLYKVSKELDIKTFSMVPVIHCNQAFGCVIEWNDGFKMSYSGDTRPCKFLSEMGKGSSVLIHEATFEDEKQNDAVSKRHSTVGEALQVSRDMNCSFSLLTHFSQRYPNLKMGTYQDSNYGLAIDLLQIAPYQYPLVYQMIEPFSLLFEDEAQKKLDRKQQLQMTNQQPIKKFKTSKPVDEEEAAEKESKRLERYQNKYKNVETNIPAFIYNITSTSLSTVENTFDDLSNDDQFYDDDF